MGWTSYLATQYKNGKIDRKAECDKLFNEGAVVKSAMVGSIYYAAIKCKDESICAVVIKTSVSGNEFAYKAMDETMNPFYYDCPLSILKLLSPTNSVYAQEWRKTCYERLEKKKEARKEGIGTIYEVVLEYDLEWSNGYKLKAGDIIKVKKERFGKKAEYFILNERGNLSYRIRSSTFNAFKDKKILKYADEK